MEHEKGDVLGWAGEVSREDSHGLVELEDELLIPAAFDRYDWGEATRSSFRRNGGPLPWVLAKAGFMLLVPLLWLASVAPIYGPVAFTNGSYRGMEREFSASGAYPVTALCFAYGLLVLGYLYVRWREDHDRVSGATTLGWIYVVCAVLTLPLAYGNADSLSGGIGLYVAPMWTVLVASVVTLVYQYRSPRGVRVGPRLKTALLEGEDRAMLLDVRREALQVLADRGLLEGGSVEELSARPLGELHVAPEDAHAARR
ncbi:hypothetical protein [Janibacter cremeus]|uniref:Uncharacterized protein n=1 Tax=Janibacter cremeus TaxID=1285192 RepID=A0A852VYE4_9MICO|nr:hypothetical protein [Janibacter cremeus]NYF98755.1 hypothetical protein [Janibacter cremeus]